MNAPLSHLQLRAPWQTLMDGPAGAAAGAFHAAWMDCLVHGLGDVAEAVLVLSDDPQSGDGEMRPVAFWPAGQPCGGALAALCEEALAMRMVLSRSAGAPAHALLAMPLTGHHSLRGVVGIVFRGSVAPRHAQDWLRWGSGWLYETGSGVLSDDGAELRERLFVAMDLVMTVLGESDATAAANAFVTEAATRLDCDRVSIGYGNGRGVRLAALSHSAEFSRRLDLAHAIEAAMNEACDQGQSLLVQHGAPVAGDDAAPADAGGALIARDHQALARGFGTDTLLSVPFFVDERRYGVVTFEWRAGVLDATRSQIAHGLPPMVGRLLLDKRDAQRAWLTRMADGLRVQATRLFGPRHVLRKVAVVAGIGIAAYLLLATGEHRVSAKAALEGGVRRVVVAPFDGYVATAVARAGQEVVKGQLLASLDDRDMQLETQRWASQQSQYATQMEDAQAQRNLAQIQINMAQARQAAAQRRLSESMLSRTRVEAPFDGLIVAGDLTQNLGGAVRKGDTLFEIAPLDSFRIVLDVDEADIGYVEKGLRGELMVTALPGQVFPLTVTLVTPVAHANEGKNQFRVEATLEGDGARLRPGMEGIGKIAVAERSRVWIWTHRMHDWLRLQAWNWFGI